MAALSDVCWKELRVEAQRDSDAGVEAIPPLIPDGWTLQYTPGCSYFLMHKKTKKSNPSSATAPGIPSTERTFRSRQEQQVLDMINEGVIGSHAAPKVYPTGDNNTRHGKGRNTHASTHVNDEGDSPRSSVTVYCPLRCRDPSLHDPTVDLCEWIPFDVLVMKPAPRTSTSLYFSLASVNSELRVRHLQWLSPALASSLLPPNSPSSALSQFGIEGEYLRAAHVYNGPLFSELAKPLQDEVLLYLHEVVGISATVREYICQMAFVIEQEAYIAWLGQLAHFGGGALS